MFNNSINAKQQGTQYLSTAGAWSGVDGGSAGNVLTSNGTGVAPTFQVAVGSVIINGDTGSATGGTITFDANTNCGSSVIFDASGSTVDLKLMDANGSMLVGFGSGNLTSSGLANIGFGVNVLSSLTTASGNVCMGNSAGNLITDGDQNVAIGQNALLHGGSSRGNVCLGANAGENITAGLRNVMIGDNSGVGCVTSESDNVYINNQGTAESSVLRIGAATGTGALNLNKAFICGIQGITVTGTPVLISASDQLGVAVSSERFKQNIEDMEDSPLMNLRPVTFNWRPETGNNTVETQYGLIAEEVAEIFPYLCVFDKQGNPMTVKYHEMPAILLKQMQKQQDLIVDLQRRLSKLECPV